MNFKKISQLQNKLNVTKIITESFILTVYHEKSYSICK